MWLASSGLRVRELVNESPSQNLITMTTVHNLRASLRIKYLQKFKMSNRVRASCSVGYRNARKAELLHKYAEKEGRNTENDNKSKFLRYCFELVFITCVYDMSSYVWGCKIRPWSAEGPRDKLG